jgi:energy-coupling factor transporter ATP-binding protein EcfA2
VSLGIATIGDPRLVCLDEPTTGMDPVNRQHAWNVIQRIKADRAVILTSHNMLETDTLSDRVGIMAYGKVCGGRPLPHHGCVVAWLRGCVVAWLRGCVVAWLRGCVVAWLRGCVVAWLRGCVVTWLRGCVWVWVCGVFVMLLKVWSLCTHACTGVCASLLRRFVDLCGQQQGNMSESESENTHVTDFFVFVDLCSAGRLWPLARPCA